MRKNSAAIFLGVVSAILLSAGSPPAIGQAGTPQRPAAEHPVSFDVYLPIQKQAELNSFLEDLQNSKSPNYHHWLTPQQFHQRFSPSATALQQVENELSASGFAVTQLSPRHLQFTGTVRAFEQTFLTQLATSTSANNKSLVASTPLSLTPKLRSLNALITKFSSVRPMHSNAVRAASPVPQNRTSSEGPYWFTDLKQAYDWPSYKVYTGRGTTIGILMTGAFRQSDMNLYFSHEKLTSPHITQVDIDGGAPFDANGSIETHLDIQQAGGMAPNAHIILYNIPDLSQNEIEKGLSKILEDNKADVVSMSFSIPEVFFTRGYNRGTDQGSVVRIQNDLFKQGNAQGITFVTGSGDLGALSAPPVACFDPNATSRCGSFQKAAEFPGTSPNVTAVGGTNLITTHNASNPKDLNSAYVRESAFADPLDMDIFFGTSATGGVWGSGGGDSIYFKKPSFQNLVNTHSGSRTVPDLALHMGGCPGGSHQPCNPDDSSVVAAIDGNFILLVGTSASSPDFAGLIALSVEKFRGRMGNANPYIYTLAAADESSSFPIFHDHIPGFNGLFNSHEDYNRVVGNGTLHGRNFLLAPKVPPAGVPQTSTNP